MERRCYDRIRIDSECMFLIKSANDDSKEFSGQIVDICEGGIRLDVSFDCSSDTLSGLELGDSVFFQAYDEYMLNNEPRMDVFDGEAKIVRINRTENSTTMGCSISKSTDAFDTYLKNKRISLYFS